MSGKTTGWIKLYSKFTEWEWYHDVNCRVTFLHLLLSVNYKPSRFEGKTIPAGSRVCGYPSLAEEIGISVRALRTVFSKLKATGELTVKTHPKYSVVSITNWEKYQGIDRQASPEVTGERQASDRRATTSKEDNNTIPNGIDTPGDVRGILFQDGLASLKRQTGQPDRTCRGIIGKWLKASDDDCAKVLTAINQAEADRVFDPVAWITKAVEPKKLTARQKWGPI
ncbi:hypothetical protein AB1P65_09405 [Roseibium alexandrii]